MFLVFAWFSTHSVPDSASTHLTCEYFICCDVIFKLFVTKLVVDNWQRNFPQLIKTWTMKVHRSPTRLWRISNLSSNAYHQNLKLSYRHNHSFNILTLVQTRRTNKCRENHSSVKLNQSDVVLFCVLLVVRVFDKSDNFKFHRFCSIPNAGN